jgi:hypothetical protein
MADVEKPQPMEVDPKKPDGKVEDKPEMVREIFLSSHYSMIRKISMQST